MFKWTSCALTALAFSLPLSLVNARGDVGCLPPPITQDYFKKTVRVEIKGTLKHVQLWLEGERDPNFPTPNVAFLDYWQVTVGGKTYTLEVGERKDFADLLKKLDGKAVIVTGTLAGETVQVAGLKADEDSVKQTTEVEARGQLSAVYARTLERDPIFGRPDILIPVAAWTFVVDGKTYTLTFATPELEALARSLDGKSVVLSGTMDKDTITVTTLKAAQ